MLFSAGWTLDQILELNYDQLTTVVHCILSYKAEQLNLLMGIASEALGGKVNKKSKASKKQPAKTPKEKEASLLAAFASSGIEIS